MINTIVFDVGNVLAAFCWQDMFHGFGLTGEDFDRLADATVYSSEWSEFDKGILRTEEIIDIFSQKAPEYRPYIERIFADPTKMIRQFPYTKAWLKELKERGYRIYILSNWSKPTYDACLDSELDFLDLVDGRVFSFEEHVIKPDPKIFDILCQRYGIIPQEAIFLDDTQDNVIAAREFGMHAIHFKEYEQGRKELEKYL